MWHPRTTAGLLVVAALSVISVAQNKPPAPTVHPRIIVRPPTAFFNSSRKPLATAPSSSPATESPRPPFVPRAGAPPAPVMSRPAQPALIQPRPPIQQAVRPLQPPAVAAAPGPAITPLTPSSPAQSSGLAAVDYRQGKLSVVAEHANLGKVLELIGAKTGASIEVAPEVASESVIARLGPGSFHQVLTQLLNSPRLDYIVMGSDDDAPVLQTVVVRRRGHFGGLAAAVPGGPSNPVR